MVAALASGACSGASNSASSPDATPVIDGGGPPPPTYVLVHGAFMGGWAWADVAAGLEAKGANVSVVDLPAHGADMTPIAGATLDAYVAKVGAAVDFAAGEVVLVGHSLGGVVITEVAEQRPKQIGKLVYLAAFVPKDGQMLAGLILSDKASHLAAALKVNPATGTGSLPFDKLQDIFCADCSAIASGKIVANYRDEPLAPLQSSGQVTDGNWGTVKKFYIHTRQDNALTYEAQQAMIAGVAFDQVVTLDVSHSPFLSQPSMVVDALTGF